MSRRVKRRDFLASVSSTAALAVARPSPAAPSPAADEEQPIGEFILHRVGTSLRVAHQRSPERTIWESARDGNFIIAEVAKARVREFGTPEGSFDIRDTVSSRYGHPSITAIRPEPGRAIVSGAVTGAGRNVAYNLTFQAISARHLRFEIRCIGTNASAINRIRLRTSSSSDEAFFGFGQQLTYFNQKGKLLPIIVQEHGVGRGQPVITQLVDLLAKGGGGTPYATEAPAPHYISSKLRSMFLENTQYSVFDLRHADVLEAKAFASVMSGRILYGDSPLELIEAYTEYAGRMRELPDWVHRGVIVGVQGGSKAATSALATVEKAKVPLAGFWIQDWVGTHVTSVGVQLWWNWRLDEGHYSNWREIVAALRRLGGRMLIYINPFLSDAAGHDALFLEGQRRGYLVRRADDTPYLIKNTDFSAAMVDLSNPQARSWIKGVIKSELIGNAEASGWMADFGEALPFDAKLFDGADPAAWHNRYTEEWARVNREAIEEAGRGSDIVFFNRSGFTQSPAFSTLFWLGDQLQNWDEYDGIKTAVVGVLSGGISGFSLLHSDTGGYTTLSHRVAGRKVPVVARSPELFMRWMELSAFTCVFRTHEGLDPAISAQIDSDAATLAHLKRFATIYAALAPYRKHLVADAARNGYPVVRHPFLHFPADANTWNLRYQFMLGPDLMVAPVLDKGVTAVDVYFPAASRWRELWSGALVGNVGEWSRMPAPLSKPALFLRDGGPWVDEIVRGLKGAGIL